MDTESEKPEQRRLNRISDSNEPTRQYDASYSIFIRWLRLILPVIAVAIIAVVFTWDNTTQDMKNLTQEIQAPIIGRNELLNPRFENKDKKNQPYTITAMRATQGQTDDNLIILEKPLADMLLNSGRWLAAKSNQGAYRQDTQRLLMTGNVEVFHDQGYQLNTESLNVDMKTENIWSEVDVFLKGPEGTIEAKAMDANNTDQILKFFGPAKLTLTNIKGSGKAINP